jgi:wyosine [tRNA(Phe)-imidazoG37] synthetase (radical SAM superfamily)
MVSDKKKAIKALQGHSVFIWGARMTGLGAWRALNSKDILVAGFIDSDSAFVGKEVRGLPVHQPSNLLGALTKVKNPAILVAVALKEEEILNQLSKLGITNIPVLSFQDEKSPYYTIDILSSCNLKCASCPHSIEDHGVPKGSMTLASFKQVVDKITHETPDISHISLYSWGEPLLHPYIDEVVQYIHDKNIAVALSSNLSIRFDDRLERLIEKNPDYLKVSLSGYYPDAYNNTHEGGDINLVKSNLYRLRYLMDKYGANTLVDVNYHLYRDNSGINLEKFRELANELGFVISETYALVMPLERVLSYFDGNPDLQTQNLEENLLVTIREGVEASSKSRLPKNVCPFRENQININADLSVPVCCTVFQRDENVVAQNFLNSTLEQINQAKKSVTTCDKCMQLALPEYNMGFNRAGWETKAKLKTITDTGLGLKKPVKTIKIKMAHE